MAKLLLNLSESTKVRLNPWKRITKGTTVNVVVDGVALEAIVDNAGKYSYLNVDGVDYYVSAKLEDGMEMTTSEWTPAPKKAPAEPKIDPDTGEVVEKPKKARKPKAKTEVEETAEE